MYTILIFIHFPFQNALANFRNWFQWNDKLKTYKNRSYKCINIDYKKHSAK